MPSDVAAGKIKVLWNMVDYPVPEGCSFPKMIRSLLATRGYTGEVSVTGYDETNPYRNEDGFTFVQKSDKYWRLSKMLVDICYWALGSPLPYLESSTLMVVAKNMDKDMEFVNLIQNVKSSGFHLLLVVPDGWIPEDHPLPKVDLAWYWESILGGGEPIPELELEDLLLRVKQSPENVFNYKFYENDDVENDKV